MGYRNCVYDSREQCINLFTWDENGKRVRIVTSFNPYLYIEDARGNFNSIFNTKLVKKSFKNSFDRNKFIKDSGIRRVFEKLPPVHQFLIDTYWRDYEKPEFLENKLKTCYIDIETYGGDDKGFPNPEDTTHVVNVITCFDSLSNKFHTFGLKPYKPTDSDTVYVFCKSEKQLFINFIEYLEKDYPDIISGWNILGFDIPYIVNRCNKLLGEDFTKRMSPVGVVRFREFIGPFGNLQKRYHLDGISIIDYLELYKRFTLKERDSYKLNNIAEIELGQNKVDFGGISLNELADTDWDTFVKYNLQDVNIIVNLENKLQFISLLQIVAYSGLCTLEQSMSTLTSVTGALTIKAKEMGKIVPTFTRVMNDVINPGAFVAEPKKGFQEYFTYFDASSLYPNTMITLNISPETKVGRLVKDGEEFMLYHVSGKEFRVTPTQLEALMKKENLCLSKADILFSQKDKGIVPLFVDSLYSKRMKVRNKMMEDKKRVAMLKLQLQQIEDKLKTLD